MSINIKKLLFAGVVLFFSIVGIVFAQSSNTTIPECNSSELEKLVLLITDNEVDIIFAAMAEELKDFNNNIDTLFVILADLGNTYYKNMANNLPECALAMRWKSAFVEMNDSLFYVVTITKLARGGEIVGEDYIEKMSTALEIFKVRAGEVAFITTGLQETISQASNSSQSVSPVPSTEIQIESTPAPQIARPGNCATAVAMGLTAQQAAQWSHLDRDSDGEACYGT